MIITIVAGARPNFMKIAPIISAITRKKKQLHSIDYRLVHTGQHYDNIMSQSFFNQLDIPEPNVNLGAGGGTQAEQTAQIMIQFEKELVSNPTDMVLVVGDVTSTMACAIVARKLGIHVAHVEAGIRSGDWSMPEEINRVVTDSITNYFFTTSEHANNNLRKAGVSSNNIFFVGNTMIDTLLKNLSKLQQPSIWKSANLIQKNYIVVTLHRPNNVDSNENLQLLINAIIKAAKDLKIVFPVHPRTRKILGHIKINASNLYITDPMPYLEFNYLVKHALAVVTDSGGITEETTVLNVPCMTLRNSTERPETCEIGTNELLGTDPEAILPAMQKLVSGNWKKGNIPELWDGKAAERIVDSILHTHDS